MEKLWMFPDRLLVFLLLLSTTAASVIAYPDIASICRVSDAWQVLPHRDHCQRFYVCTGDEKLPFQEFSCPAEYHFSKKLRTCVPGSCSDASLFCGTRNSVERISSDCSLYRHCLEGGAYYVAKCSAGNYFDPGRKACLPVAITAAHQCSCVLPENATLSNSNDCETYFRCHSGQAELVQCPAGNYFDERVGSCIPDHTGICLEKPTMPPTLTDQALAMNECIRTGSRLAPHSRDCQRYYVCAEQRVLEMRCPRGQYFDAVQRYCSRDLRNQCQEQQVEKLVQESEKLEQEQESDNLEQEPEEEVAQLETLLKNTTKKEVQKQVLIETAKKEEYQESDGVNAKQPLEAVSNYDKFSSKFISF
uniref:Peritrophin-48 isoform X1 n=1 Tax=Drosophila rhopaloa TaxID=1041015 RepID=A0A6P4DZ52_DRORH